VKGTSVIRKRGRFLKFYEDGPQWVHVFGRAWGLGIGIRGRGAREKDTLPRPGTPGESRPHLRNEQTPHLQHSDRSLGTVVLFLLGLVFSSICRRFSQSLARDLPVVFGYPRTFAVSIGVALGLLQLSCVLVALRGEWGLVSEELRSRGLVGAYCFQLLWVHRSVLCGQTLLLVL
jgi:hypothetical protein